MGSLELNGDRGSFTFARSMFKMNGNGGVLGIDRWMDGSWN
jgi:hypothetical protein